MDQNSSSKPAIGRRLAVLRKVAAWTCLGCFAGSAFFFSLAGALAISIFSNFAQCYLASEFVFAKIKPLLAILPEETRSVMTVSKAFRPKDYPAALQAVEQVYGSTSPEYQSLAKKFAG